MIVDVIVLAVIIIAAIIGRKKGLTVCLLNVLSVVLALIVAFCLYKPIGNSVIKNTKIKENLKQSIQTKIPLNDADFSIQTNSNLPAPVKKYIESVSKNATEEKDKKIDSTADSLADGVIYIAVFLVIFIVVRAILLVVKILSKVINKLPVLKQIDHIGGTICGAIEGILITYAILAVISIISPILEETAILKQINKSHIAKNMYNNNIVIERMYDK